MNLASGVCLPKLCSHPLRTRMCHSHTHLGKHFGCLRKAFSVLILLHYCQFWSPAHEFSEETLCLNLLTRSSVHRTPWFTMCRLTCVGLRVGLHHSRNRDQPVHTSYFVETFGLFQVSNSNSGTLPGNTLGVNLPIVDCWQNSVLTL